ncbi:MAG TPA: hypothetical protein VNK70_02130 [Candidatus Paceibacterota bacterium]|nr:hypothetical protein [Candidatus Paceibacterota bacterium]
MTTLDIKEINLVAEEDEVEIGDDESEELAEPMEEGGDGADEDEEENLEY